MQYALTNILHSLANRTVCRIITFAAMVAVPALADGDTVAPHGQMEDIEDFSDYRVLAVKSPASYGFENADEARDAVLGRWYPMLTIDEWRALASSNHTDSSFDPKLNQSGTILQEVLGSEGRICCALITSRTDNGQAFKVIAFGYKNLQDEFEELRNQGSSNELFVVLDPETRKLHWSRIRNSSELNEFMK